MQQPRHVHGPRRRSSQRGPRATPVHAGWPASSATPTESGAVQAWSTSLRRWTALRPTGRRRRTWDRPTWGRRRHRPAPVRGEPAARRPVPWPRSSEARRPDRRCRFSNGAESSRRPLPGELVCRRSAGSQVRRRPGSVPLGRPWASGRPVCRRTDRPTRPDERRPAVRTAPASPRGSPGVRAQRARISARRSPVAVERRSGRGPCR
jgi:hypothetical protein